MGATAPTVGTGTWSEVGGPTAGLVITNVNSATTTVTGLTAGNTVTLRWTISNGACTASTDDVVLSNEVQPVAEAGPGGGQQDECGIGPTNLFSLGATAAIGTGTWSKTSGDGIVTFSNVNDESATVWVDTEGSYTLAWTDVNGLCSDSDEVTINFYDTPTASNAGPDITQCNTEVFTMAANVPVVGSGTWSEVGGPTAGLVITNVNSATTTVTGLAAGSSANLRWTISNGACTASTDDVVLSNEVQPVAEAGPGGGQCGIGPTNLFSLGATAAIGTGTWSKTSGDGIVTFSNVNDESATVWVDTEGSYTLAWTDVNGLCSDSDEVTINFYDTPTASNAGPDITQCNTEVFTMAANVPVVGSGSWGIVGADPGVTITNTGSATTTVTGLTAGNTVTLRWTISNGACTASTDDVVLSNEVQPVAEAGPGGDQCGIGPTNLFSLGATAAIGTGTWSKTSGDGIVTFSNVNDESATVWVDTEGSYTLAWTDVNGLCSDSDEVTINFYDTPTASNAGPDITQCNTEVFTMAANVPVVGSGSWGIVGADPGVTITNTGSATTTVTGLTAGNTVTLRWTISNGACTASTDDVVLSNEVQPVAEAGPGGDQCGIGLTNLFSLGATAAIGTGTWSKTSGDGIVTFSNVNDESATVWVDTEGSYTLAWTDVNGLCSDSDEVTINFYDTPTASNAGPDITQCNTEVFTMAANVPVVGSGTWSEVGGPTAGLVITNVNSATTTVTGLAAGSSANLRWTISNGACTASTDDVVLSNEVQPVAEAGPGGGQCGIGPTNLFSLGATAAIGTGTWSKTSGDGIVTFSNVNDESATVWVDTEGSYTLAWTDVNGLCSDSDEVTINFYDTPTASNAGPDITQCNTEVFTMAANVPVVGSGSWGIVGADPGVTITNTGSATTTVTGLTAGNTVTLRWTISNGACTASTDDVVLSNEVQPVAEAGPGGGQCGIGPTNLFSLGATAAIGTGTWSKTSGDGIVTFSNVNDESATVWVDTEGSYTLAWTDVNGLCSDSDEVTINFYDTPTASNAGPDITQCNTEVFTMAANVPVVGSGSWGIVGADPGVTITNTGSATTTVTGLTAGNTVTLRWTISNGACTASTDDVVFLSNEVQPVAEAGPGGDQCGIGPTNLFSLGATAAIGTGTWSKTSGDGIVTFSNVNDESATVWVDTEGSYTLAWTDVNGLCSDSDEVTINFYDTPTASNAGPDITQCNTEVFTMAANVPVVGSGSWGIVGADPGVTITNTGSATTTVTGLTAGNTVTLRWTISNGACTASTDDVVLSNEVQPVAEAGPGGGQCGIGPTNLFSLGATAAIGTGTWSKTSGDGIVTFSNVNDESATVWVDTEGSYTLAWTDVNGLCSDSDEVTINFYDTPTASNAGPDITQCNTEVFTMAANVPVVGSGSWGIVGADPGVTITNTGSATTTVTGLTAGNTVTLRWTISNGACTASTDDVVLSNEVQPVAEAGPGGDQCGIGPTNLFSLGATAAIGTGTWSKTSGDGIVTFSNVNDESATVWVDTEGSYTLAWTDVNGLCSDSDEVTINFYDTPTASNAGPDITQCNTEVFTMAANVPVVGSGSWGIVGADPGVTITNTGSATTTVTGLTAGNTVTLRWTISNGACTASTDDVVLSNEVQPVAEAGPGGGQCGIGPTNLFSLGATAAIGTGTWSKTSGDGIVTFSNVNDESATVWVDTEGSYTLAWTDVNGLCSDSDEVTINFYDTPTASNAGPDITQCNTEVFTMAANVPVVGSGSWGIVGADPGVTITNTGSATTTVTGLTAGNTVTLRWTISNGACTASTDDVVLSNEVQPVAEAGPGGDQCGIGPTNLFSLGATAAIGTGTWSKTSGDGIVTFSNVNDESATVWVDTEGSYTLAWTDVNGLCSDSDEVTINFYDTPTASNAGPDITQCNTEVFTMAANVPVVGSGSWGIVGADPGVTITNTGSATTTVTGLTAGNTVTLRWTISNGACTASTDDVVLSNEVQPVAEAGPGGDQCGIGPTNLFSLGATAAIGTGTWSKTSGDGIVTFSNVNDESATVWVDTEGSYTLAWTDVNGLCSDSDEVTINFYDTPTASNAGPDITQCNTEVFTMAANVPVVGSGSWGIVGADPGVTITNTGSATTTVTGLTAGNTVTLRWTISNGACTASTDDVVLSNEVQPVAEAGPGGDQCGIGPTNLFSLGATAAIGTGTWSKTSGDGIVTFSNVNDESATVWVDTEGSYTLAWTDVNGLCSDSDEVTINFYDTPTASNAGPDITQCNTEVFTMAANVPVVGSGSWGIVGADPGVTITNTGSATTTVTGLTAGNTVTLRWTISNGACTASTDDVVLSNEVQPVAEAGPGGDQCGIGPTNLFSLGATAAIGTGTWSKTSGDGIVTFSNVNDESATVWVDTEGSYTLAWTDVNGLCSDSDEVTINFYDTPTASNAGPDITQCNTEVFTMAANVPVVGSGSWGIVGADPGVTITNTGSATTTVTGLTAGNTVTLRWTISNGACTASTDDVVLSNEVQPVAEAGPGGDQCGIGPTNLFSLGATAAIGTGTWSKTSGDGIVTFSNVNDESATVWVDTEGSYTLAWTDVNGLCSDSDEVTINFYDTPTASNAGPDITQCNTEVFTMAANVPVVGSGSWGIVGADPGVTITNTGSATTTVTGLTAGNTVTLRWTISNGACTASTDDVVLSNEVQPVAEAGPGGDQCGIGPTNLFSLGATAAIGTGTWSKTSGDGIVTFSNVNDESATVWVDTEGSYTLAWTDVNGLCSDSDEVTINFYDTPTASNAGPDITQCNTEVFTMAANVPVVGSGSWGIVGADPGVTITNTGSATTTVTGLTAGNTVTLRWTISNGACTASTDDVVLSNEVQPVAEAGPGGDQCGIGPTNLFSLGATAAIGTGTWSKTSGDGIVTFSNVNDESATVWVDTEGSYTLAWTDVNGLCSDSDEVTINFYDTPTASNAGPDITQCNTEVFTMAANVPVVGSGSWGIVGADPGVTITNTGSATTTVTGLTAGNTVTLRWTISNGACTASTDDVVLSNEVQPVAEAGPGGDQCGIGPTNLFSLGATAAIGTGTWSKTSGDGIVTFSNVNDESATVWVDTEGSYTLAWTDVNGLCSDSDEVTINFYDTPTASNAGPDITQCNTEVFTMAANVPVVGTGTWSEVGGPTAGLVITNVNSATTTVTGLTAGSSVTLRWTISNGPVCGTQTDDVVLTNDIQPIADAGSGGNVCGIGGGNPFTFTGASSTGSGVWTYSGPGTASFTDNTSATSSVTVDAYGSYTFTWTETNGTCSDFDEVSVEFWESPVFTSAGADITQCNTGVFTMGATAPTVGTGTWSEVGGPTAGLVITNVNSATTTVTGLTAGSSVTLRWTISNGPVCGTQTDDVVLTNDIQPIADAGSGGNVCGIGGGNPFTFTGVSSTGSGLWTYSGPGNATFTDNTSATSSVTVDAYGSYTFTWTETNGTCSDFDEVSVEFWESPVFTSAGADITQCNTGVFTMGATAPTVGTGTWSEVGGPTAGLVITNVNSATTTVTGLTAGSSVTLRWTISNGPVCGAQTDDVVLTNDIQPIADAGSGGNVCGIGVGNPFTFTGVSSMGSGVWTYVGPGGAVFSDNTSATSSVTVDAYGSYTFTWTETNGTCSDSDEVTVTFSQAAELDPGAPAEVCSGISYTVTDASANHTNEILWTHDGSGALVDATTISPTYTPAVADAGNTVVLTLTATGNGACPDVIVTKDLAVTPSVIVDAGSNEEICEVTDVEQVFDFSLRSTQASSSNDNGTYNWVADPVVSGSFNDNTILNPTFEIVLGYNGTITFTLTAGGEGSCGDGVDSFVLLVRPTPSFSVTSHISNPTTINSGELTDIQISTTSGFVKLIQVIKSDNGLTGNSPINTLYQDGFTIQDVLENSTDIQQDIQYIFEAFDGSCTNPDKDTARVYVNPAPEFEVINTRPILCPSELTDITVDSETSGAVITLLDSIVSPNPNGITGMTPTGTSWSAVTSGLPFNITDGLVNSTDTIQTVRYIFEVNASGLTATKFTEVAVNPLPDFQLTLNDPFDSINSGTSTLILINTTTQNGVVVLDSIRKTGNILGNTTPGVTFVDGDQITDNLTNGTNSPQTITYYFSARANGCINAIDIDSAKVVVIPAPELVITNNQPEVCPINKTDIDLYSPTADAEVELTNITIIPDATGVSNFSPIGTIWAGGPTELVAKIADSLINSSDVIQTITYDLRISANGFTATTNKTVSVEIRPNPQMSLSNNNPNILSNTSTDIFINTPTENGQVELSAIDKDEDILGNTSAGVAFTDGNRINDVLVNNSDTILSISYIFRATANTCINPDTDTVSVTVNPIPNFTITNALPILCPEQKSDFEVTSPTANAEISLTAVQIAPNPSGVTGFTTPATWTGDGSGLVLEFKDLLENLTDTIQTVTYEFDIEANGFDGTETKTVSVEVNPLPRQVITNSQPVVNVDTKTDILINTTTENGGALLLDVIKDAGIVGNTTSGVVFSDSDRIEDELVNQTDNVLTIKYVFKATANGCENSETDMAIVEVNPNPRLTIANNKPIICSGETVDIQISSPTAGATIRLVSATAVPDAGSVVGLTPDNFTWNTFPATISDELSQTTNVIQRVEYLFEVSVPGYANPVLQSAVVDVKPLPDISASGPEICSGGVTSVDIGNPNSVSFTVFNWTVSDANGNIEGEAPGTGNRITQVLDNTTVLLDSVIYRIYATAQLCAGDSIDVVQRVYPQNVAIAGTDTVVCQGTPAITIETANIAGGSTAASWSKITGGGTLTDETTLTPTYAPDPIDEVGTITLELTASNASVCPPVTDLVSIIINSKPTVEAGSNQTICEGSTALMSEAMIGGSAASVTWSDPSGKGSFLPNNATLNAIFEPHPDQVGTNVKLYVETNDPSGPCVSAIDSLYITINDAPEVSAGADQTICEGDVAVMSDATIGGGTSSVTWSGGAGTWDDVHKLDATYTPDASEIGEVVILTITTDDPDGPCTAISDQIRVAVNKAPEVYAGTDQIVCEGETVLIGDATSGGSTTSVLWTGGTGTFSPNNTTLNTTYIHAAGEVNSTVTLTITTNDPDGPCVAVSDQIDITINDAPEVFAGADQTICEGDVAVMSEATIGGGTSSITWSGGSGTWDDVHKLDATYTPDASEIGSVVILTITTDDPAGPCTAISDQIRVAVNKAPEVFAGVDKVICEGDQVLINDATSGGSTTSVLWTGGTGEFSPNNTTLNTTYIHAAGEVNSTVTLTITTNDPDGPCVAVSDQIDITINDAPEVFAGADQTICEGDVAVMSDATYGGGTSSITWSGGAGTWDDVHKLDATYTPDASEIGSVVILTITTDDPDGPCTAISDQIRVAVNKAPEVFSGVDKVICEGDQVLINDATSGGSTTSVLWTGGTGTFSPNNTTLNTTYIHAAGEVNSTVTLTITTNDPDGPCVAVSDQIDITINDAPEVFAGADQTICEGDVAVMSDATYGGGTSSITWSGGSGTWDDVHKLDATYTPDASEIGSVVILTITTDDPDGPCAAISDQIRVAVNKAPEVFAGVDKVICEGEQVLISDATSGGSTTSVLWTGGTGTFSPNNTTLNTTYIHAVGEVNSTVTLTITTNDPDGPCVAVTDEVNITIDEAPTVDAGVYAPVCIGDAVQLNGLLGGSASSATWTGGVGEFDPDRNSTNARYIADESEQGGRVLLTLTTNDPDGVCVASSATTEIVVNRLPSPKIFFLKDAYQIDDAPETLVGEPSPGIFDGSGMFESTFIPAVADIGVHTITYTHTDGNGCTNFVSQETEVFPLPESEVGNPDPYCLGVNPTDFPLPRTSNTDELEDSWFGDNVFQAGDDYYFNNVAAGVGLHAIDYIVVNRSTGARDTLPRSATVYDVAKVNFTNINKCIADSIQFVDLSVLEDADVFGDEIESWIWEFGKGSNLRVSEEQNPKILFDENEPDNYFVKLEVVTKLGQCASDFAKDTIKVGAIPDADFFVSNLTSGELAQFSDATGVPNPRYISGSFIDPTTSIDSIWWDFGEPPAQFGAHQIYKNVEHRFSEPKEYNVKMVVKTNLGCRDTVTRSISILQVISTFPHITDFDTPPINDQAHRPDTSSWRLMVPDGNIIKGTSRAWVTSDEVTGRHKDSEHSFVALDAYDLRSLVRPMFTMDVWSNAESTRDGAMLQYSFNGNQWFTMIDEQAVEKVDYPAGQIGLNWYNEKGLVSRPGDGTIEGISGVGENEFAAGWTGIYDSWRTARFPLDDIRTELIEDNHISVRFRVVFASDEQNPEGTDYDGFAFDNIIVSDRSHNVLIEHFDNLSSGNQINLMNETAERFSLDMIALQYHTNYPQADVIYLNNKFPVETRGSIYDISQSPRAFMDGISEYNFTSATIEKYQIVNRSMIDPVFDIQLTPEKIAPNTVTMDVIITAQTAFDEEVTLYTMPIETSITRLDELNDFNIDSLNNIVKDLLPSGGLLIDQTWEVNDTYSTQLVWDLNQLNEGNEIYDTTKLGVIVFVQNAANEGSREIYQAIFEKLPVIQPTPITGLDDDLNARRIAEAEIYPNPADQHFNVALSGKLTSDVAWVIVDQRGIELQNGVFYKGEDLYQVDAAALPAGLHMMIFSSSEDHRVIRKIIINR
jgi:predicted Zn-dependent protease